MEESLQARRKYKDKQKFDYEDDVPAQIKPERVHYSSSSNERIAVDFNYRRRDQITETEPGDADAWWQATKNQVPMGKAPLLTNGAEMDKYFDELLNENNPNPSGLWNEENIQNEVPEIVKNEIVFKEIMEVDIKMDIEEMNIPVPPPSPIHSPIKEEL